MKKQILSNPVVVDTEARPVAPSFSMGSFLFPAHATGLYGERSDADGALAPLLNGPHATMFFFIYNMVISKKDI